MPKIELKCPQCNNNFLRYHYTIRENQKNIFCSRKCKFDYDKETGMYAGKNNPNYGKKWTEEKKRTQSLIIKEAMKDPEVLWKVGSANRGKKFDSDLIGKMHAHRSPESYSTKHTEQTKKIIGQKSKEKWTDDYKEKNKQIMVERGYWVADDDKTDWEIYKELSNWKDRMWDRSVSGIQLIEDIGIFNSKTNSKGAVRDHIFSRFSGFRFGIFPEIIRHPANCRIISHSENVRNSRSKEISDDLITIDELFLLVKCYNECYNEQDICIKFINDYNNGKRWKRKE